jgi:hypothetical protein
MDGGLAIPKLDRPRGQHIDLTQRRWQWHFPRLKSVYEVPQIVCPREIIADEGKNSLQCLLDRLLGMKTHNGICDIQVRYELPDSIGVLVGLTQ